MSSLRRYECRACTGVTWGAPNNEECGVCGAIAGLGGNHRAIPCEWCRSEKARPGSDYCAPCGADNVMFGRKPLCTSCFRDEPMTGSTYCAPCADRMAPWLEALPPAPKAKAPIIVWPAFEEESRLYPVG